MASTTHRTVTAIKATRPGGTFVARVRVIDGDVDAALYRLARKITGRKDAGIHFDGATPLARFLKVGAARAQTFVPVWGEAGSTWSLGPLYRLTLED